MTTSVSSKKDIDVAISDGRKILKKAFHISGKTIVVIHPDLVERLRINDTTWFEEEIADNGILLRINHWDEKSEVRSK